MDRFNGSRRVVLKGAIAAGVSVLVVDKAFALVSLINSSGATGQSGMTEEVDRGMKSDIILNQANIFDDMMFAQTAWAAKFSETGALSL